MACLCQASGLAVILQLMLIATSYVGAQPAPGPGPDAQTPALTPAPGPLAQGPLTGVLPSGPTPGPQTPVPGPSTSPLAPGPGMKTPTPGPSSSGSVSGGIGLSQAPLLAPSPLNSPKSTAPAPTPRTLTGDSQANVISSPCIVAQSPTGSPVGAPAGSPAGLIPCYHAQATETAPGLLSNKPPPPATSPRGSPASANAPGNNLNAAAIPATDTTLEAVLAISGADVTNPISSRLQEALETSTAEVLKLPEDNVTYVETRAAGSSGRRLLAQSVQVVEDITASSSTAVFAYANTLASALTSGALSQALAAKGVSVTVTGITFTTKQSTANTCTKRFHHWCLDGRSLTPSGVRGIIAGGVLFIVLVAAIGGFFTYRTLAGRRPARSQFVSAEAVPQEQTPEERALFTTAKSRGAVASPSSTNVTAAAR